MDALDEQAADRTMRSLASLMQISHGKDAVPDAAQRDYILAHTLIRRIEPQHYDPDAVLHQRRLRIAASAERPVNLRVPTRDIARGVPPGSIVTGTDNDLSELRLQDDLEILVPGVQSSRVAAAGQLPTGFRPERLYPSRNHPRGLQLSIFAASDVMGDLGIELSQIKNEIRPDEIATYAGCAFGQLDGNGIGGMIRAPLIDKRVTSKQLPLGLVDMPGDFVSAYVLGNLGRAGCNVGACATFLYNLGLAVDDIRSGRSRMVLVGTAEAPITSDITEGFYAMRAIAGDRQSREFGIGGTLDYSTICRPFAENHGFTLAESAVFMVLMDDELALSLGARILGAAADVFLARDGFKASISQPGAGNYLTMGKAVATADAILGTRALRNRTYVHAHGTGTPVNRITESHVLDEIASAFSIGTWPVAAIKCYIGHSMSSASGDQLAAALGYWQDGIIPGITTIDRIADDVHRKNLEFLLDHRDIGPERMQAVFVNSKGFGGNNATAVILAPDLVHRMLVKKHGKKAYLAYAEKLEQTVARHMHHDEACIDGSWRPVYLVDEDIVGGEDMEIDAGGIRIPGYRQKISLDVDNPYADMT